MRLSSSIDIQFWTTNTTKRRHAFITFSSPDGATAAFKGYNPPSWWNGGRRPLVRYLSFFLICLRVQVLMEFLFGGCYDRSLDLTTLRISIIINLCFSRV